MFKNIESQFQMTTKVKTRKKSDDFLNGGLFEALPKNVLPTEKDVLKKVLHQKQAANSITNVPVKTESFIGCPQKDKSSDLR